MKRSLSLARTLSSSLALGLLTLAGVAHAQTESAPPPPPPEATLAPVPPSITGNASGVPAALVQRSIVLPNGTLEIRQAGLNINLSKDAAGKPILITIPNISFGVAENVEVGIYVPGGASFAGTGPTPAGAPWGNADGICVTSKEKCGSRGKRFDSIGVEGLYKFLAGDFQLAGHGALNFSNISDPMYAQLGLGVLGKYQAGNFAFVFDPAIYIGVTKRSEGNKESLSIPVSAQLQAAPNFAAFLNTGIYGPTDHFGDLYAVPVGIGGLFNVNPMIDVGATFTFGNLLGKMILDEGRADVRSLFIFANIRPIAI